MGMLNSGAANRDTASVTLSNEIVTLAVSQKARG
jgi:hypothetical protein